MSFSTINRALCASVLACAPLSASAAVVSNSDTFSASQSQGIALPAVSEVSFGPSWLDITATASAGTGSVNVFATTTVSVTYDNTLSLDEAKMAQITMKEAFMQSGHSSTYFEGGSIASSLNVGKLSLNFFEGIGGTMDTVTFPTLRRTSLGEQVTAISNPTPMAIPVWAIPGANVNIGATTQTETRHALTGLTGFLRAEHEATGTVRQTFVTDPFAALTRNLDLGLEGTWNIGFSNAQMTAKSEAYLMRGHGGSAEYKIGLGCGDPGDDSDNGTLCVDDGEWVSPPQFSVPILIGANTHWLTSDRDLNLGSITVTADLSPAPVPVPASGALMLALMGAGMLARRRQ